MIKLFNKNMIIKLDKKLVNLKNEPLREGEEELRVGKALSNIVLAPQTPFSPLKALEIARKLYGNSEVEIDKADFQQLKEAIEKNKIYPPLITGQLLEWLMEYQDKNKVVEK